MVGHDDDWQQTRDQQVAYEDLPVGEYIFKVKAVDRDLNYSKPAQLQVTIHPDYGQIALQAGLALSLVGLVLASTYGNITRMAEGTHIPGGPGVRPPRRKLRVPIHVEVRHTCEVQV